MSLRDALSYFEEVLASQGNPLMEAMLPGVSEQQVREALQPLGVTPHPDLFEWFGWHNGSREPGWFYLWGSNMSLGEAVSNFLGPHSAWFESEPPGEREHWLPLFTYDGHSDGIAMDCNPEGATFGGMAFLGFELPPRAEARVDSLEVLISQWARLMELGEWEYEPSKSRGAGWLRPTSTLPGPGFADAEALGSWPGLTT